ncbi:MAG: hypothetical protein BWX97_00822 [Firmicutes bacterium ADurb.Bin146]|nr:MAG: hypothetical protein BWX97_00822 [Firmicutes bacterium ADurb.Bin146]
MEQLKLTEEEKLEYLKKIECTTKEDLLKKIEKKIKRYEKEADENLKYPKQYYALMIVTLTAFYEKVKVSVLFDSLPDYWAYYLEYGYDEFSVNLYHMSSFEVDEDMAIRKSKVDAIYKLIVVKPISFTVEQYSKIYEVEQGTVRQWIRRGKLRTAFKAGTEWKIPELTPPPSRGYEGAQYKWINGVDNLPDEYQFLNDYVIATFYQDQKDRSKYHVLLVAKEAFFDENYSKNKELLLDAKEREKLELFMIAHPQIKYCGLVI